MNPPAPQLLVALLERLAVIRISGRANFNLSVDFKRVVAGLRARGRDRFALELSQCQMMDSTFLGVVAKFALDQSASDQAGCAPVTLIAPQARVLDMLDNLGVKQLFNVVDQPAAPGGDFHAVEPAAVAPKLEISRTCLEAHELLIALNPANAAKFRDVTSFLAEDVKRQEREGK